MDSLAHSSGGQRRARAQLSCTPCRQGKLKCNRAHPACDQCIKRSREDTCCYVAPPPKAKQSQNMRGRIRHLENLVVDLMNKNGAAAQLHPSTADSIEEDTPNGPQTGTDSIPTPDSARNGISARSSKSPQSMDPDAQLAKLKIGGEGESTFVGGTHWASVLEAIDEVKVSLEDAEDEDSPPKEDSPSPPQPAPQGPAAIFGNVRKQDTKETLLEAVPSKSEVDQLIFQWFNSRDPFRYVIHGPTFQNDYKTFWDDKSTASTQWLGLLFSLMGITSLINEHVAHDHRRTGTPYQPMKSERVVRFRELAASALTVADFTRPKQYTAESMMMYAQLEYLADPMSQMKMWIMIGLVVRIALRMGYHRDASHFRNVSVFEGEMRRRTWHLLYQMDVLISFTLGLPAMVRHIPSDARPPHNLLDEDFDETCKELPPERPYSQLTGVSYAIAKSRICYVFGAAADMSHAIVPPQYSEIMRQDKLLKEAIEIIPPALKLRPMAESITDPADVIMTRFNLALLSQKTRCILHRKYLIQGQTDPVYSYSREQCLDAAMTLLKYHSEIYVASQPGGQLQTVRWYMSGLSNHDFLLAGMIVCLELNHRYKTGMRNGSPSAREMIESLEQSYQLWQDGETYQPTDSHLATRALEAMLQRIKKSKLWDPNASATPEPQSVPTVGSTTSTDNSWGSTNGTSLDPSMHDLSDVSFSMPNVPAGFRPSNQSAVTYDGDVQMPDFNPIGDMIDTPFNLNWESWDQTITAGRDQFQSAMMARQMTGEHPALEGLNFVDFSDMGELDNQTFLDPQLGPM